MSGELRRVMARQMTEDELLLAITEAATLLGWRWHHARRADSALTMGHQGFPDLVLARDGRVVFIELKTERGVTTTEQRRWLEAIDGDFNDVRDLTIRPMALLIRPTDLDAVLGLLR